MGSLTWRAAIVGAAIVLGLGHAPAMGADKTAALPFAASEIHLGVSSCGGSSCHGALQPWPGSTVLQNEFITWEEKDPHAKAYKVLLSERSKKIAAALGLPNAYEAKECLGCHADNVPADRRAKGFNIADGVGCEACHGGAVEWLGPHVSGKSDHATNLKAGMFPAEEPVARAQLCLSCHFGDADRVITHRIMGAGHPRLQFELDTFTATEPAHYVVDSDYARRKTVASHVQVWAVGQVMAINSLLTAMVDPKRNSNGIFPELVFFDCYACHHPMSSLRWEPRESTGIGPGTPRITDANLIMLGVYLDQFEPGLAATFHGKVKALHQASLKGHDETMAAARALKEITEPLVPKIAARQFSAAEMRGLLLGVINRGMSGAYVDYAAAEQATMALSAILDAMKAANVISADQYKALSGTLDKCYAVVEKDEAYTPKAYLKALQDLEASVSKV